MIIRSHPITCYMCNDKQLHVIYTIDIPHRLSRKMQTSSSNDTIKGLATIAWHGAHWKKEITRKSHKFHSAHEIVRKDCKALVLFHTHQLENKRKARKTLNSTQCIMWQRKNSTIKYTPKIFHGADMHTYT